MAGTSVLLKHLQNTYIKKPYESPKPRKKFMNFLINWYEYLKKKKDYAVITDYKESNSFKK